MRFKGSDAARAVSLAGRTGLIFLLVFVSICAEAESLARLKKKAESGSVQDQVKLADVYFNGRGTERSEELAAYWYEKAAHSGDPGAQQNIGYLYEVGIGVTKDPVRAVRWFERAAAGGSVAAKVDLALAYLWGTGVRRDPTLSVQWLQDAAGHGSGRGACLLGDMYASGVGVSADPASARHWYEIASKHNDPFAQYRLGIALALDKSENRGIPRALALLRKAATAGLVPAKYGVGWLLARHPELEHERNEADKALSEAASAGYWMASAMLGFRSLKGVGRRRDPKRAYYWFRVARAQGGNDANQFSSSPLETLATELGAARTEEIEKISARWAKKHNMPLQFVFTGQHGGNEAPSIGIRVPDEGTYEGKIVAIPKEDEFCAGPELTVAASACAESERP